MQKIVFALFIFCVFLTTQVLGQTNLPAYKNLPVKEFRNQIATGKNIILLDVRTPEEFARGYVAEAININFFDKNFKEKAEKLPANKPVYIYCAVGGRSAKASAILAGLNRKEVYNLEGGFTAWQKVNYPIQK